jgi:signal transduction histidine kinase
MDFELPSATAIELAAAYLQAAITIGLVALCVELYRRYRKPYLAWWALAWLIYALRMAAIISFLNSGDRLWLYWHQVATGWTALALLWAALVFSQQLTWRWSYLILVLFPPLWSYVAIYRMDNFLLAALPAVFFLSGATLWTGWTFFRYSRQVGSRTAATLTVAMTLWAIHHLDYPFLRAQGAWNPWGYYLDIAFELAVGVGIVMLVLEDLDRGLAALSGLSGDLQGGGTEHDLLGALLARLQAMPAVRGSAMYVVDGDGARFIEGVGACARWAEAAPPAVATAIGRLRETQEPEVVHGETGDVQADLAYTAALPVLDRAGVMGAIVVVGEARDPFAALDTRFLVALGQQVGAALEKADLYGHLQVRTDELERLSTRMVQQHEEERRRLSRELHDETAQVLSAVRMQLGVLQEDADPDEADQLEEALGLLDTGIASIRRVTHDLRPSLLDDLGLLPALRALTHEFSERSGVDTSVDLADRLPLLSSEAELALFRALQEGLSNVARHADARNVRVTLTSRNGLIALSVEDDGRGPHPPGVAPDGEGRAHMGLVGMRERIGRLGGSVEADSENGHGMRLCIKLPVTGSSPGPGDEYGSESGSER